jgi:hypothetical protein
MAQQTAVEWLVEQLQAPCRGIPSHIIDQAKQMEKEQIIDAFEIGWKDEDRIGEEYYNETYVTKI